MLKNRSIFLIFLVENIYILATFFLMVLKSDIKKIDFGWFLSQKCKTLQNSFSELPGMNPMIFSPKNSLIIAVFEYYFLRSNADVDFYQKTRYTALQKRKSNNIMVSYTAMKKDPQSMSLAT